ncbi:MAG: FHA domain-containing protein [Bryobacterales bacterium]|nr:FHA domain-containing protein [Bryobacterales bacterium]
MKLAIQVQALDSDAVQQFEVPVSGNPVLLGRGPDSPVPLEGVKLSRNHLALAVTNGQLTLTDLSSNGVWVNAQSVPKKSAILLHGNEEIAIPGYRLRVRLLVPAQAPAVTDTLPPAARAEPATAPSGPQASPALTEHMRAVSLDKSNARSMETMDGESVAPADDIQATHDAAIPWWRLSGLERVVLVMIALSAGLFFYYYSIY